jgi:anhydro-N-acetylmuramic acid kinase
MSLYIGLMSGTSMDGIDAALVELSTHQLIVGRTYPYEASLKSQIQRLIKNEPGPIGELFQVHRSLGEAFAEAANQLIARSGIAREEIQGIGSHGQTILHAPEANPGYTVQLGCGHTIAARTGLTVVADFRVRDVVQGGEGAPLAPLYHHV